MALLWTILATFAVFSTSSGEDAFQNILTDVTSCEESCSKSYSPHTNPDSRDVVACGQGCRFYSISEFVMEDHPDHGNTIDGSDANPIKNACYNACVESYNETAPNTAACKFGCNSQELKVLAARNKEVDEGPSIHLLSPIMQVHAVYSSFVGAVHIVRSSLVTYFMSDDNSVVAVESQPKFIMEVLPEDDKSAREEQQQQPREWWGAVTVLESQNGLSVEADPMSMPVKLVRPEDLTRLSLTDEDDLQAPALPTKVKLPDSII
ncbi:transmembrane protein 59 [Cherax quadricarinatus]|uniref:transmembrane protein 59 n=1 Tax=Cherax quadricarinatus TaxID=27406 RepID=UPI00387E3471